MKVGTDGVLLGAWADIGGCRSILDVGTGSGLIALMMAQRNGLASITAIEIDSDAAMQPGECDLLPFEGESRCCPSPTGISVDRHGKFDAIVSNPPFLSTRCPTRFERTVHDMPVRSQLTNFFDQPEVAERKRINH